MSTREAFVLASLALVWGGCAGTTAPETPNLGRAATPADVAGWDISIAPDGRGLPSGSGTSAEGALVYAQKCQACHGDKGVGGPNDRLVGGHGSLASKTPVRTVGSYWPYATTVYLLSLNGIIGEQDVMNSETLPKVKMPNRDNFILVQPWKP